MFGAFIFIFIYFCNKAARLILHFSVPVSKLPELVYDTKQDIASMGLISTIVGHVGDGNFHALILFQTEEEKQKTKELVHRMVKRAIALDGTCS